MAENKYYGIYQAIVSNIDDTEKRGRIKVKCPDVLGANTESAWCEPVVPIAYDNGGDFCLPQEEEAVWILFIGGDANKPVYLGGWWSKDKSPLGTNYSNLDDIRIISYANCTIVMKNGVIDINVGEGTCDLKIEHNKVTVKGDLTVEGDITANKVTSGSISAVTDKEGRGGILSVAGSSSLGSVSASNISAYNVTASNTVKGKTVKTDSIDLATHVHGGVTIGGDKTSIAE